MPGEARTGSPSARAPYTLIALLSAGLLINYVDRGSISIAAPLLEKELQLAPAQTFLMRSAFFWAYVPAPPLMGWLADQLGAARVLAAGFAFWSVSTFLTGLSAGIVGRGPARDRALDGRAERGQ